MILYHGSNIVFDKIDLNKSKTNKDFGKGFYLSDNYEQAEKMAQFKVVTLGGNVIVQSYEANDLILDDDTLNIKIFTEYSKEWAEFILPIVRMTAKSKDIIMTLCTALSLMIE